MNTKLVLAASLMFLSLAACSSKESPVNPDVGFPLFTPHAEGAPQDEQHFQHANEEVLHQKLSAAIAGKVLLTQNIPVPLSHVLIGVYRQYPNGASRELARMSTETDGGFVVTQKLPKGSYTVKVLDKRFRGEILVDLDGEPSTDLILQATRL